MALKLRLARGGSKQRPYYRLVVAEATAPRDGRFIEKLGTYNPLLPSDHAERLTLKIDRIKHWMSVGAKPTERVEKFLAQAGLIEMPALRESPKQSMPKARAQERLRENLAREEAAKEAEIAAKEAEKAAKAAAKEAAAAEVEAEKAAKIAAKQAAAAPQEAAPVVEAVAAEEAVVAEAVVAAAAAEEAVVAEAVAEEAKPE